MKRRLFFILAIIMVVSCIVLASCGESKETTTNATTVETTAAVTTKATTTEATTVATTTEATTVATTTEATTVETTNETTVTETTVTETTTTEATTETTVTETTVTETTVTETTATETTVTETTVTETTVTETTVTETTTTEATTTETTVTETTTTETTVTETTTTETTTTATTIDESLSLSIALSEYLATTETQAIYARFDFGTQSLGQAKGYTSHEYLVAALTYDESCISVEYKYDSIVITALKSNSTAGGSYWTNGEFSNYKFSLAYNDIVDKDLDFEFEDSLKVGYGTWKNYPFSTSQVEQLGGWSGLGHQFMKIRLINHSKNNMISLRFRRTSDGNYYTTTVASNMYLQGGEGVNTTTVVDTWATYTYDMAFCSTLASGKSGDNTTYASAKAYIYDGHAPGNNWTWGGGQEIVSIEFNLLGAAASFNTGATDTRGNILKKNWVEVDYIIFGATPEQLEGYKSNMELGIEETTSETLPEETTTETTPIETTTETTPVETTTETTPLETTTEGEVIVFEDMEAINNHSKIDLWGDAELPYEMEEKYQKVYKKNNIPTIQAYLVEGSKECVVIFPGGGYGTITAAEATPIAQAYNAKGISAFVVNYRCNISNKNGVGYYSRDAILADGQRGIQFVRYYARGFGIDPNKIAVCGFSAGGHLAMYVCEHPCETNYVNDEVGKVSSVPNACILSYPVTVLSPGISSTTTSHIFHSAEEREDQTLIDLLSYTYNPQGMPPTYIWYSVKDTSVNFEVCSVAFAAKLQELGIKVKIDAFSDGGHGIGLATDYPEASKWLQNSIDFLSEVFK